VGFGIEGSGIEAVDGQERENGPMDVERDAAEGGSRTRPASRRGPALVGLGGDGGFMDMQVAELRAACQVGVCSSKRGECRLGRLSSMGVSRFLVHVSVVHSGGDACRQGGGRDCRRTSSRRSRLNMDRSSNFRSVRLGGIVLPRTARQDNGSRPDRASTPPEELASSPFGCLGRPTRSPFAYDRTVGRRRSRIKVPRDSSPRLAGSGMIVSTNPALLPL